MLKKKLNFIAAVKLCFLAAVILALSSGIARALLCPKEVNSYESRMADQLPAALSESFPEQTEAALSAFIEENRIDKILFLGYLVSLDDMSFALGE